MKLENNFATLGDDNKSFIITDEQQLNCITKNGKFEPITPNNCKIFVGNFYSYSTPTSERKLNNFTEHIKQKEFVIYSPDTQRDYELLKPTLKVVYKDLSNTPFLS